MNRLPAESELIGGSGMHVLHKHVGRLDQLGKYLLAVGGGGIERKRFLAAVELKEIKTRLAGDILKLTAGASPLPGRSILMTSAPNHASICVHDGPDCT